MKLKLKCWIFILSFTLASEVGAQPTVTLPAPVGEFYLHAYYKWQRDSTLLVSSQERERSFVVAVSVLQEERKTYQADSVNHREMSGKLDKIRVLSIDSTATQCTEKMAKLQSRSTTKGWIIAGLFAILMASFSAH